MLQQTKCRCCRCRKYWFFFRYESDGDGEYCVISIGKYVNGVYIVNYSVRDVPASIGELASDEKKLDAFVSQYCKIDNYKPVFYFAVEGVKGWHRIFGIG